MAGWDAVGYQPNCIEIDMGLWQLEGNFKFSYEKGGGYLKKILKSLGLKNPDQFESQESFFNLVNNFTVSLSLDINTTV